VADSLTQRFSDYSLPLCEEPRSLGSIVVTSIDEWSARVCSTVERELESHTKGKEENS